MKLSLKKLNIAFTFTLFTNGVFSQDFGVFYLEHNNNFYGLHATGTGFEYNWSPKKNSFFLSFRGGLGVNNEANFFGQTHGLSVAMFNHAFTNPESIRDFFGSVFAGLIFTALPSGLTLEIKKGKHARHFLSLPVCEYNFYKFEKGKELNALVPGLGYKFILLNKTEKESKLFLSLHTQILTSVGPKKLLPGNYQIGYLLTFRLGLAI